MHDAAGDIATDPGPIDTSLSPGLTRADVRKAMKKVADWSLANEQPHFTQDWTCAPLYTGLLDASKTLDDKRYHDAVLAAAEKFNWQLLPGRPYHADDEAIGQVEKAGAGMLKHIYQDGRLGAIQPIGAAPVELQPGSTWLYGVGGFLQAGAEIDRGLGPAPHAKKK